MQTSCKDVSNSTLETFRREGLYPEGRINSLGDWRAYNRSSLQAAVYGNQTYFPIRRSGNFLCSSQLQWVYHTQKLAEKRNFINQ